MEEDEDVMVEGGVLFSYLDESGYSLSDFETIQPVKKKPQIDEVSKCVSDQEKVLFWIDSHLKAILKSGLLFDDHSSFIEAFQPLNIASEVSMRRTCIVTASWWMSAFGCAVFLSKNFRQQAVCSLTLTCVSLPVALYYTHILRKQRDTYNSLQNLQSALAKLEKLFIQLKKCTLMVQEAEALLSKFKLPGIELLEFRKIIRSYSKEVVYHLSNLTENLMKSNPLDGKVDATAYCMSKEEIETAFLDDDHEDAVSVGTLKRMFNIYLLVQSELLRRLALCYCPDMWLPQTKDELLGLSAFYVSLAQWSSEICQKLEKAIKVYEAFGGTYERKSKMKGTPGISVVCSDVYIAIRSSSLHLQSVLARSRDLEESLETNISDDDADSVVFFEGLLMALKDMQKDLRTSQVFFDDAIIHVLKTKNSLSGLPPEEGISTLDEGGLDNKSKSDVTVCKEIEPNPPVEDEVFEVVIKREDNEVKEEDEEEISFQEEREQRAKEKQKSLKVLSELKVVLKDKASEWKVREKIALQKKGCSVDDDADSLGWLPTSSEVEWPLPRLKNRVLNPRKRTVRRASSVSSKSEQSDEEKDESGNDRLPFVPGTAFDTTLLAEAMKKSLVVAGSRTEDCFGDSGEQSD